MHALLNLLQDIYKPETARLRRHLSAIINFAKFREEKLVAYTEMQQRIDQLLEERRALEDEHQQRVRSHDMQCMAETVRRLTGSFTVNGCQPERFNRNMFYMLQISLHGLLGLQ